MSENIYDQIEAALRYLVDHFDEQPSLKQIAGVAGLSEFHFQRLFSDWVGISPKKFLQYLTLDSAKKRLASAESLLDASFAAGLSGPGRLHDLFVVHDAVTPGEFKHRGAGLDIGYGFHSSPFGECLILATDRGLCGLGFIGAAGRDALMADLGGDFDRAEFIRADGETAALAARIFEPAAAARLPLLLRGTPFQIKVWEALLRIPEGALVSYGGLAARMGRPKAARAVASAVAANPISYLIPCHRVIRETGVIGKYRWGRERKAAMLAWEAANSAQTSEFERRNSA